MEFTLGGLRGREYYVERGGGPLEYPYRSQAAMLQLTVPPQMVDMCHSEKDVSL